MKRLTVLRHAKSSWEDPELRDFDRPLNDRGRKAARRIGREFRQRHFRFDLVLASAAVRVRETLAGLQEEFDSAAPVHFEERLYLASEATLLSRLRDLPDTVRSLLVLGHNPGLHDLLLGLAHRATDGDPQLQRNFPTAAVAVIELPAEQWSAVGRGSGKLVELILPKRLD